MGSCLDAWSTEDSLCQSSVAQSFISCLIATRNAVILSLTFLSQWILSLYLAKSLSGTCLEKSLIWSESVWKTTKSHHNCRQSMVKSCTCTSMLVAHFYPGFRLFGFSAYLFKIKLWQIFHLDSQPSEAVKSATHSSSADSVFPSRVFRWLPVYLIASAQTAAIMLGQPWLAFPFPFPVLVSVLLAYHIRCFLGFYDLRNFQLRDFELPNQFSLRHLFVLMAIQNCNIFGLSQDLSFSSWLTWNAKIWYL